MQSAGCGVWGVAWRGTPAERSEHRVSACAQAWAGGRVYCRLPIADCRLRTGERGLRSAGCGVWGGESDERRATSREPEEAGRDELRATGCEIRARESRKPEAQGSERWVLGTCLWRRPRSAGTRSAECGRGRRPPAIFRCRLPTSSFRSSSHASRITHHARLGGSLALPGPLDPRPSTLDPQSSSISIIFSAIWTALSAAPLRMLSATTQRSRQWGAEVSWRMRPT